ncbi:MAG TPA: hypothetical protein VF257_17175 [Solirubrobacteraceae bacterium]
MNGFFDSPYWDLLLVLIGALLGLILHWLAFGRSPPNAAQHDPLSLSDLPMATPPSVRAEASARAEARATVISRRDKPDDPSEIWLWLGGALAVSLALAAFYLKARHDIAVLLRVLAATGLGVWLTTYAFLLRRGAIVGSGWLLATILAAIVFVLARADVEALAAPRYVAARDYNELLAMFDRCGISGVVDFDGFRGVTFVVTQLVGVVSYVVAWALATTLLTVLVALFAARFNSRPVGLWTRLARVPGPWREHPLVVVSIALALALGSWALCGGAAERALANRFERQPKISQAQATMDAGRITLLARSDFAAEVTVRLTRSGHAVRTFMRDVEPGLNRWSFAKANGRPLRRGSYRLRLVARDDHGSTAEPLSIEVPGRFPATTSCDHDETSARPARSRAGGTAG